MSAVEVRSLVMSACVVGTSVLSSWVVENVVRVSEVPAKIII